MARVGVPPGLAGELGGFGHVGEARLCYSKTAAGMARLQEIEQNVEHDAVNPKKHNKELSKVCWDIFKATRAMFEQKHLRIINMLTAVESGEWTSPCSSNGTRSSPRH